MVPYFGGVEVPLELEEDTAEHRATLARFVNLTIADRDADSRHVYAYYKDFHAATGGEDWLDTDMGIPAAPEAIWDHVTPGPIQVSKTHAPDTNLYVVMEAECAWEDEHGLMLVWRNGTTLSKVSGYDGHMTNVGAYDDGQMHDIVYQATDPAFSTRRSD